MFNTAKKKIMHVSIYGSILYAFIFQRGFIELLISNKNLQTRRCNANVEYQCHSFPQTLGFKTQEKQKQKKTFPTSI